MSNKTHDDAAEGMDMADGHCERGLSRRLFLASGTAMAAVLAAGRSRAQRPPVPAPVPVSALDADIANAEGVRAIKRLQRAWGHYAEAGDFAAMADLFASNGRIIMPPVDRSGRAGILAGLRDLMADGGETLAPDRINIRLMLAPVVTLARDGQSGKGRWHELAMTGVHGARADWAGGIHENDYVREDGVWKIATLHYHPQFAGPYATGWRNVTETVPRVPYHYTPDQAGTPVPRDATTPASTGLAGATASVAALAARAHALVNESAVQNLQAAYGYYMDRKAWDDVADLFAPDGRIEIGGAGVYAGRGGIRRGLERFGPAGLTHGQLFDHLQLMPIVTLAADGASAQLRCIEVQMLGQHGASAQWGLNICDMTARKQDGIWMITSLRVSPRWLADYDKGWADAMVALPGPSAGFPPDALVPLDTAYPQAKGPAIGFAHPVSSSRPAPHFVPDERDPAAIRRDLHGALAHDGAENVATAYGYYIDEFQWDETADLFATNGWKELSYIGTYIGRESIRRSLVGRYGRGGRSGAFMAIHQKVQPFVTVLPDGRARIRLKLFQVNSAAQAGSGYINGIYEEQIVQEHGVWKIHGMDLDYVFLANYAGGWAAIEPGASRRFAPRPEDAARMAPDGPLRGAIFAPYPDIGPSAFHFANPVTGRKPATLLPWSDGQFS